MPQEYLVNLKTGDELVVFYPLPFTPLVKQLKRLNYVKT